MKTLSALACHWSRTPYYFNDATIVQFADELVLAAKSGSKDLNWFDVKNQTAESADIYIYDEITPYIPSGSAKGVVAQLAALKDVKTLNVRLNSPGGSVFEGVAIYNALTRHPGNVIVHVDGLAASIASVIAMAGKEIRMAENAMLMIHDPWCFCGGGAKEMRKQADVLDQIKETIINVYVARTGKKRDTLAKLMEDETWFTAEEAVAAKMADTKVKAMKVAANFKWEALGYAKVPATLTAPPPEPEKPTTSPSSCSKKRERELALLEIQTQQ
jgi:ATP-dependent Clp protease protease subunit